MRRVLKSSLTAFNALLLTAVCIAAAPAHAACPRLLEVDVANNQVKLTNLEAGTQPGGYWLCNFPSYLQVGLYSSESFANPIAIMDYMEYGSSGHPRSSVAETAGVWTDGDFVILPPSGAMKWTGSNCNDPGSAEAWSAVVSVEIGSFAAVKAFFD